MDNIGFRSVVHSDILSERPATLAIILMPRAIGIDGILKQAPESDSGWTTRRSRGVMKEDDRIRMKLLSNELRTADC